MSTTTASSRYPLRLDGQDRQAAESLAAESGHSLQDVLRLAVRKGLPQARAALCRGERITKVEPLSDAVLDRIYAESDADEAGTLRFMAAQSLGGDE